MTHPDDGPDVTLLVTAERRRCEDAGEARADHDRGVRRLARAVVAGTLSTLPNGTRLEGCMSIDATIARANRYLNGTTTSDVADVLKWREELRSGGQPVGARALSRKLAERLIAGDEMRADEVDAIWKACKQDEAFSYARRVLARLRAATSNITPAKPGSRVSSPQKLQEQAAMKIGRAHV